MKIKDHLNRMLIEAAQITADGHVTEPDEFVVVKDVEIAIHEMRKVFERTKAMNETEADL